MARHFQNDDVGWDRGREGYVDVPQAAKYTAVPKAAKSADQSSSLSIRGQERVASLITSAGMMWGVYIATTDYTSLLRLQIMPPGPVEVCGLGILLWLHAKWRRSLKSL